MHRDQPLSSAEAFALALVEASSRLNVESSDLTPRDAERERIARELAPDDGVS